MTRIVVAPNQSPPPRIATPPPRSNSPLRSTSPPSRKQVAASRPIPPRSGPHSSNGNNFGDFDYNAIEKIADGVEKMVRSWSTNNAERAQMYAKAFDTVASRCSSAMELDRPSLQDAAGDGLQLRLDGSAESAHRSIFICKNFQSPAEPVTRCMDLIVSEGNLAPLYGANSAVREITQTDQMTKPDRGRILDHARAMPNYWLVRPGSATLAPSRLSAVSGPEMEEEDGPTDTNHEDHSLLCRTPFPLVEDGSVSSNGDPEVTNELMAPTLSRNSYRKSERGHIKSASRIQHTERDQTSSDLPFKGNKQLMLSSEGVSLGLRKSPGLKNRNSVMRMAPREPFPNHQVSTTLQPVQNNGKPAESYKAKVEELEISLLECATEYEVKIVEMKMKMLQMKSEYRQKEKCISTRPKASTEFSFEDIDLLPRFRNQDDSKMDQTPEGLRKQLSRLLQEKNSYQHDLVNFKKKERRFELQRRSMEDAQNLVGFLQKQLAKREQEVVDYKLREKELKSQLHELQIAVHKARAAKVEPSKLLSLLLALREWLHSVKAGVTPMDAHTHLNSLQLPPELEINDADVQQEGISSQRVEEIASIVTKEIKSLQNILGKLAHRKSK